MRISDWSSDVCSSDLGRGHGPEPAVAVIRRGGDVVGVAGQAVAGHLGVDRGAASLRVLVLLEHDDAGALAHHEAVADFVPRPRGLLRGLVEGGRQGPRRGEAGRSEEHTSELQSLMRISYAVFCLNKKKISQQSTEYTITIDKLYKD